MIPVVPVNDMKRMEETVIRYFILEHGQIRLLRALFNDLIAAALDRLSNFQVHLCEFLKYLGIDLSQRRTVFFYLLGCQDNFTKLGL